MKFKCIVSLIIVCSMLFLCSCSTPAPSSNESSNSLLLGSDFSSPSPSATISPSPAPQRDSETEDTLLIGFNPLLLPLCGDDFDDFDVVCIDDHVTVNIWSADNAAVAESAISGNVFSYSSWQQFVSLLLHLYDSLYDSYSWIFSSPLSLNMSDAPDSDLIYLTIEDHTVSSDLVQSSFEERCLYSGLSNDDRYFSAQQAIIDHYASDDCVVVGGIVNPDRAVNGNPAFQVSLNFRSPNYSVYDFQSIVQDSISYLDSISSEYYVLYSGVNIYFRLDDDNSIEYTPSDLSNLFVGKIHDSYNDVYSPELSVDHISAWYSGDDFSEKASVSDEPCTYDEYLQIENGMTYSDVVGIIGSDGVELSSVSSHGTTASVYQWDGSKQYSNVVVEFVNGLVVSKAQSGLS